jgi:hypothetical protein
MAEPFTPEQIEQIRLLSEAFSNVAKTTDPLAKAQQAETKARDEAKTALKEFKKTLGDSAISFSRELFTSGQGTGKFGRGISEVSNSVGNFSKTFGRAGALLGNIIKIMGGLASASLKQNDQLMKSYQNLSNMGYIASDGLEGLHKSLGRVGLMAEEAEKFERVLTPITKQLATFGGSVSAGTAKLLDITSGLIGPANEFERGLARLGYSTDDIREGTADFVQRQARLGKIQETDVVKQRKEVYAYLTTLKDLQELTGLSRDEAQKEMDMQMADARMTLYLRDLKGDEAKNLQLYLAGYKAQFGAEAVAGLQELIVNQGQIVGKLSAQSYNSTLARGYPAAMAAQKQGQKVYYTSLKSSADATNMQVDRFRGALNAAGEEMKETTGNFEQINGATRMRGMTEAEYNKQLAERIKIEKGTPGRLENNVRNEQKLRAVRVAGDQALSVVGDLVVGMFTKLTSVMFQFGKVMAKVMDYVNKHIFNKETNLADQFRTPEDIADELKESQQKEANLLKALEIARADLLVAEKKKVDYTTEIAKERELYANLMKELRETKNEQEIEAINNARKISDQRIRDLTKEKQADDRRGNTGTAAKHQATIDRLEAELRGVRGKTTSLVTEDTKLGGTIESQKESEGAFRSIRSDSAFQLTDVLDFGNNSGSQSRFEQLNSNLKDAVIAAATEFKEFSGGKKKLKINSAIRTFEEQKKEWDEWVAAGKPKNKRVAEPGTSLHEKGMAVDIQNYNDTKAVEILKSHGLKQPFPVDDKMHFTARTGGMFSGPESGYPVTLHGKEAVVRLDQLANILKKMQQPTETSSPTRAASKSSFTGDLQSMMNSTRGGDTVLAGLMTQTIERLDQVIEQVSRSNRTQNELLTVTRTK